MAFWSWSRRQWKAASALSWRDWSLLGQAWWLLLRVDLGLRLLPFPRVQEWTSRGERHQGATSAEAVQLFVQRGQRAVEWAARHHLYSMGCLRRCLALQWLLSKRGIHTELRFGVRKSAEGLCAHAWLEPTEWFDGADADTLGYVPLMASAGR